MRKIKGTKENKCRSRQLFFVVMLLGIMTMGACNSAPVIAAPAVGKFSGAMLLSPKAVTSGFPREGKVTASALNVRKGAGTENSIMAVLKNGHSVEIQAAVETSPGSFWYEISFYQKGDKKTGYVSSKYIEAGASIVVGTPTPIAMFAENHAKDDVMVAVRKIQEDSSKEERSALIPYTEAFYVNESEVVYLLDTYGKRVLKVDGEEYEYISISDSVLPSDMICKNGELYIYDEAEQEFEIYNENGELLFVDEIILEDDYVKSLWEEEEGVALVTYGGKVLCPNRKSGELILAEQPFEKVFWEEETGDEAWDYSEYIGTDGCGYSYFANTSIIKDISILAGEISIGMQTAEGTTMGSYALPMLEYTYLPKHYVQIAGDGVIYLFVSTEESFEVRKLDITGLQTTNMDQIKNEVLELEKKYKKNAKSMTKRTVKLNREEVLDRANEMLNYTWTLREKNTKPLYAETTILPRYIQAIAQEHEGEKGWKVTMSGIPYCWGGFASPYNTSSKNRIDYLLDKKKYTAGNIYSYDYYIGGTAGLDCSGFVGTAYGITEKINTSMLLGIGKELDDMEQLQSMDMLLYPGNHVMLFYDELTDGAFLAAEATVRDGKVILHPKRWNELLMLKAYQMRSLYK